MPSVLYMASRSAMPRPAAGGPVTPLDVAIAGCGPGGLAAALFLHRAGHTVTVYERFERPQPVGSGLMIQPTGLAVLDALGLGDALRQLAAPIRGLNGLSVPSGRRALAMTYAAIHPEMTGYGVHRSLLFGLLFEAACEAGIAIETGRAVSGSALAAGDRRRLVFHDGGTSPPVDLVIDAMGSRSPLSTRSRDLAFGALWTTLDRVEGVGALPDWLDQRYRRAEQMAGIMPLGRSSPGGRDSVAYFWSLRQADLARWTSDGLEAWRRDALALWPESEALLAQVHDPGQFVFATYQHRTLASPIAPALAHLGDAWHATSPQLGQGANMALLDAWAIGRALAVAPTVGDALAAYQRHRRGYVRLYQLMSRLFTPVFQSESRVLPSLRDLLMAPQDRIPLVRTLAARIVAGQLWLDSERD